MPPGRRGFSRRSCARSARVFPEDRAPISDTRAAQDEYAQGAPRRAWPAALLTFGKVKEDGLGSPTVPVGFELMGATGQGVALPVPDGAVERTDKPDGLVRGRRAGARRSGYPVDTCVSFPKLKQDFKAGGGQGRTNEASSGHKGLDGARDSNEDGAPRLLFLGRPCGGGVVFVSRSCRVRVGLV